MKVYALNDSVILGSLQIALNALRVRYGEDDTIIFFAFDTQIFSNSFPLASLEDEFGGTFATIAIFQTYLSTTVFNAAAGGGGGGDASIAKQDEQITLATTANVDLSILADVSRDKNGINRNSSKSPRFNSKLTLGKRPNEWDEIILGGATSVHDPSISSVLMTVSTTGDAVIRQTLQRMAYQTGAPQTTLQSGAFAAPVANLLQKIGYYNCDGTGSFNTNCDGYWFEMNGISPEFVCKKVGVETLRVTQPNWNKDPCDGTGPSGANIDFSKSQVFYSTFLWLGTDGIDYGFKVGNTYVTAHVFEWKNLNVGTYMSHPNHSLRYEIRSTGGAGTMQHTCTVVNSEDGAGFIGNTIPVYRDMDNGFACGSGQYNPIIAVRLQDGFLDESYLLSKLGLLSTTNANANYLISINPTLRIGVAATLWDSLTWTNVPESGLEVATLATGTDYNLDALGSEIYANFISSSFDSAGSLPESQRRIGAKIDTTAADHKDVIVLSIKPINNETFFGSMVFKKD